MIIAIINNKNKVYKNKIVKIIIEIYYTSDAIYVMKKLKVEIQNQYRLPSKKFIKV